MLTVPNAKSGEQQWLVFSGVLEGHVQTGQFDFSLFEDQRLAQLKQGYIVTLFQMVWIKVLVLFEEVHSFHVLYSQTGHILQAGNHVQAGHVLVVDARGSGGDPVFLHHDTGAQVLVFAVFVSGSDLNQLK